MLNLEPHHKVQFNKHLMRWRALRRATGQTDRVLAEDAIATLYAVAGRPPPTRIVWSRSPVEMAQSWLAQRSSAGQAFINEFLAAAKSGVARELDDLASASVRNELLMHEGLARPPYSTLLMDLGASGGMRRSQGLRHLLRRLRYSVSPQFPQVTHCFHSDAELPVYAFLAEQREGGIAKIMPAYVALAENSEWVLPCDFICWLSDRPVEVNCDSNERLHSANGPALRYGDGWQTFAWKNVPVPEFAIQNPSAIELSHIANAEVGPQRRSLIEIMTPERFVMMRGADCIAQDPFGRLWLRNWRFDAWAAVEVTNGTPEPDGSFKSYFLQVPAHMRSPRQAVAWTYGMREEDYNVVQRT